MTVKFSVRKGTVSSISIVADLFATTESNYRDCEITITISDGDIHGVHVRPSAKGEK